MFDAVLFLDAIEHVRDAARVILEGGRVLKPGGEFVVTFANRNSVNQIMTRKLGYPEFVTNFQHFREFTLEEMRDLLAAGGMTVTGSAGNTALSLLGRAAPRRGGAGIDGQGSRGGRAVPRAGREGGRRICLFGHRDGAQGGRSGVAPPA